MNTLKTLKSRAAEAWAKDDGQATVETAADAVVRQSVRDGTVSRGNEAAARSVVVAYLRSGKVSRPTPKPVVKLAGPAVPPEKAALVAAAAAEIEALGGVATVVVSRRGNVAVTSNLGHDECRVRWSDEWGPQWMAHGGGHKSAAAALAESLAQSATIEERKRAEAALSAESDARAAALAARHELGQRLAEVARAGHPLLSSTGTGVYLGNVLIAVRGVTYSGGSGQVDGKDYAAWGVSDEARPTGEYHVADENAVEVLRAAGVNA
jgi:hypothetical protein